MNSNKIQLLIEKCFSIAQGGWNSETDRKEFYKQSRSYAIQIGLLKKKYNETRTLPICQNCKHGYMSCVRESSEDKTFTYAYICHKTLTGIKSNCAYKHTKKDIHNRIWAVVKRKTKCKSFELIDNYNI